MNRNYLKYLFRQKKIVLIFFFVVYVGISLTCFIDFNPMYAVESYKNCLLAGCIMSVMLALALPVLQLSYVHRKRSVDQYFALPVSRKAQLITEVVFMASVCIGYYLITAGLTYVIFAAGSIRLLHLAKMIGFSCLFILEIILIYSFLYLVANNIFDGIVVIGAYTCLPLLLYMVVTSIVSTLIIGYSSISRFGDYAWYLSPLWMGFKNVSLIDNGNPVHHGYLITGIIFALLACIGLKNQFVDRKTERAEQLSDEFFAYRFIIHIYLIGVLMCMACAVWDTGFKDMIFYYLLLFAIYVIAHFVYSRKIELKISHIAVYLASALATLGISFAGWKTKGFGIAEKYEWFEEEYLICDYRADVYKDDLGKPVDMTEYGYDWENSVTVSFELVIDEKEKDKYAGQLELMEKIRKKAIDDAYAGRKEDENGYNGWLSFMNNNKLSGMNVWTNQFNYSVWTLFSEDELKTLDKYAETVVYDHESGEEYTLEQYLKKRGG